MIKRDRPLDGSVGHLAGREQLLFLIRQLMLCKYFDGGRIRHDLIPVAVPKDAPNFIHSFVVIVMKTFFPRGRRAYHGGRETASDYTR